MKKTLVEIYALAICFFAATCFGVAFSVSLYDLVELSYPEFTLSSYEYQFHQSNEKFLLSLGDKRKQMSDADVTKLRQQSYRIAIKAERRNAFQSLVRTAVIVLINTILFVIHWQLAKRTRSALIPKD